MVIFQVAHQQNLTKCQRSVWWAMIDNFEFFDAEHPNIIIRNRLSPLFIILSRSRAVSDSARVSVHGTSTVENSSQHLGSR